MTIFETARSGKTFSDVQIIDVHSHFGSLIQTYIPFNNERDIVKNMDAIGVDKICFCTQPYGAYGDQSIWNEKLAKAVVNYPEQIYGYVTLNGNRKDEAFEEYQKGVQNGLTLGIKMHTLRQEYSVTDEFLYPVYEDMNVRKAWYLHHDFGTEKELEQLLLDFPDVIFIQGHPSLKYKRLLNKYSNLYMCTCAGLQYHQMKALVDLFGADKLLYGSDSVIFDHTFGIGPIAFAEIGEQEKKKILGETAMNLLSQIRIK